jgi:hypothetical protein
MLVSILTGLISVEGYGMRKLKFRAWDQADQDFWEPSGMIYFDIYSVPKFIGHTFHKKDSDHYESRYLIDQFTGLLDSNGVEIYKWDIILSEHDGSVVVEWSVRAAKFGVHVLRHHTYSIEKKTKLRANPRDGIVIGNIHQNPDLLK